MEQHKPSLIKSLSLLTAVIGLQACDERLVASAQDRPASQVDTQVQVAMPDPPLLPALSRPSGQFPETMDVQLAYLEPGVEYRYTLDGREPDLQSPLYLGPIQIQSDAVLAVRGWRDSLPGQSAFASYLVRPVQKDSVLDPRDGHWYRTVHIAGKEWMAENLDYTDSIGRLVESQHLVWGEKTSINCGTTQDGMDQCVGFGGVKLGLRVNAARPDWGRFYFGTENVCMEGWHVPDPSEWQEVLAAAGVGLEGTNSLKSVSWWPDNAGQDALGFRVLPTGFYGYLQVSRSAAGTDLFSKGNGAAFWVSGQTKYLVIRSGSPAVFASGMRKEGVIGMDAYVSSWAATVRCVRD
ncbi:MAG: chitobiase/beta-hexosaminidase C-terminal domain-containing protein [Fibrobacteres bacterium]|nr:chitobiase/beta-hexosaminidase C-terminal domain-containing protein [Fibrobacterota bacterium]